MRYLHNFKMYNEGVDNESDVNKYKLDDQLKSIISKYNNYDGEHTVRTLKEVTSAGDNSSVIETLKKIVGSGKVISSRYEEKFGTLLLEIVGLQFADKDDSEYFSYGISLGEVYNRDNEGKDTKELISANIPYINFPITDDPLLISKVIEDFRKIIK